MKHAVLLGFVGLGLCACSTGESSPRMMGCLEGGPMSERFLSDPSPYRILVAGTGPAGETQCFWSNDMALTWTRTLAWKACQAQAGQCGVVAGDNRVVVKGYERRIAAAPSLVPSTGPDPAGQVVWYLLGQFAQGLAMGVGAGIGASLVGAALSTPAAGPQGRAEAAPREASYSPKPTTMCNPTGATIGGFPSYVCR